MLLSARTALVLCIAAVGCGGGGGASGPAPVSTVAVSLEKSTLQAGEATTATATARDASGTALPGRTISWSTSNSSVVSVSSAGLVTALATGSASIIATSEGKTGSATIAVAPPPVASVSVSLAAPTINIGSTTQASAVTRDASGAIVTGRAVSWSSDNTAVATVDNAGVVTGASAGTANITATSEGKTASAPVTVNPTAITSVTVALASPTAIGSTTQASATFRDANGNIVPGKITGWSSDNTSVATVSASGVVSSVGLGTANITVTSDGPPALAPMTVAPSAGFGSSGEKIRVLDIGAAFSPALSGASPASTTFTSRATSVVTVDAQGTVIGAGSGQGWVAASAPGFAPDSIYVIVPRNSTGPVLRTDLTEYRVKAGATIAFNVILDTRATSVGGTELTVGYTTTPVVFQSVSVGPMGSPAPLINNLQAGLFRVSLASGSALTGQLAILRVSFKAPITSGVELIADRSGYLTLTLIDLVDAAGGDILPTSTSMRIPIIITQ
jgi:uncharacterized protein YjdB